MAKSIACQDFSLGHEGNWAKVKYVNSILDYYIFFSWNWFYTIVVPLIAFLEMSIIITAEALLGISLRGVRMLGITHRGVKMPNIQLKSSVFSSFILFSKILGGSIDPPDPLLTRPLLKDGVLKFLKQVICPGWSSLCIRIHILVKTQSCK